MNPTVARIQELFQQNDPSHYYWGNFYHFLNSHSYKAVAELLTAPAWTQAQARTLLAMSQGVQIDEWLQADENKKYWLILSKGKISHSPNAADTMQALTDFTFKTLAPCWNECSARMKFIVWNNWGSGIERSDELGQQFTHDCMNAWSPQEPRDIEYKIQALLGTLDTIVFLGSSSYSVQLDRKIETYSAMLHEEVKKLNRCWTPSTNSVHIWRQLHGYPDFLAALGSPHPWMESLCVAYTGAMIPNLPEAIVFRKQHSERTTAIRVPWLLQENVSNPKDKPLAQALWQYFSKEPVMPEISIQALYYLLEGIDGGSMVSTLFTLGPDDKDVVMPVDSNLFDYQP